MSFESMLIVAAILFAIGLYGSLARRNVLTVLMSIELMFNAVNLTLVALGKYVAPAGLQEDISSVLTGQVFAVFVITVAAAEIALGLGIVFAMYRSTGIPRSDRSVGAAELRGVPGPLHHASWVKSRSNSRQPTQTGLGNSLRMHCP